MAGGEGTDSLYGNSSNNTLTLTGINQGSLDALTFSGFENVYLAGGDDTVNIQAGGQLTGILDGGTGTNTLIVAPGSALGFGSGGSGIAGGISYSNFYTVSFSGSNPGTNTLNLNNNANTLTLTGAGSGTVDGTSFINVSAINLLGGSDTATIAISGSLTAILSGGAGIDSLYGNTADNILILTGINEGSLDGVAFSSFENVYLGAGNDKVYIKPGGQLTGILDGGTGSGGQPEPTPIIILPPGPAPDPGPNPVPTPFPYPQPLPLPIIPPGLPVDGGNNSIYLNDNSNILTLTGAGSGIVDGTVFSNFYAIEMRGGDDFATFANGGSLTGSLDGGSGTDSLTLNSSANSLSLNHLGIGSAAGTSISGFELFDLAGGDDSGTLNLSTSTSAATSPSSRTINGGLGSDALTLSLSTQEIDHLKATSQWDSLRSYAANPTGQSITINFLAGTYTLSGFESASGLPDPPVISLAVSPTAVSEDGIANLIYTFTRSGPTTSALSVNYTVGGTATLGTDYTGISSTPSSVTFAAGAATATVTVDPTADNTVESDETVALTLASGNGYSIGTTTAVVGTISNDDSTVTLAVAPTSVTEDGASNLVYTFTRVGFLSNALTVNYTVAGTATLGTDYTGIAATPATKTVTFAAGAATATVTVDPTADNTVESDETVALTLASGNGYSIGTTTAVVGTISNDDIIGTAADDTLTGTTFSEFIDGKGGRDTLTGGSGADTFGFGYTQSSITAPDLITDFQFGTDKIDLFSSIGGALPAPAAFSRAANNTSASTLSALAAAAFSDANAALTGNQALSANSAVLVIATNAAIAGTYLLINDSTAALNTTSDLMINITGYSGAIPGLGAISPIGSVFS